MQQNTKEHYLHYDHLGSVSIITDANGLVAKDFYFDPWGASRTPDVNITQWIAALPFLKADKPITSRGFTGHEHLDEVGLIHMNGRIYDAKLARFVQADPIIQDPLKVQSLNRYSYVWNNPLNATDPSGFQRSVGAGMDGPDEAERRVEKIPDLEQVENKEEGFVSVRILKDADGIRVVGTSGIGVSNNSFSSHARTGMIMVSRSSSVPGDRNGGNDSTAGSETSGAQGAAQKAVMDKLGSEYERALQKVEDIKENVAELATDASFRVGLGAAEIRLGFSDGRPAFDVRAAFNKWSFHAKGWSVDLDTNWFANDAVGDGGRLWLGAFAQARGALGPFRASLGGEGAMFLSNGNLSGYTNDQLFNYDAGLRFSKSYSVGVGWRLGGVASDPLF